MMRRICGAIGLGFALAMVGVSRAGGPADDLLALVPADSGVTLVADDLRGRSEAFAQSPFARELAGLPAVKAWWNSSKSADLAGARREIESVLGISLARLRDDLLGDAVVLAIVPPAQDPRGLLLTRFRDRPLLDRLIARINAVEKAAGTLVEVREHRGDRPDQPYWRRHFAPGTKPDEFYAILGADTLAWANSEAVLRGVIARHAKQEVGGLAQRPAFREVRDALPESALLRLYIDPRFLSQLADAGAVKPADPFAKLSRKAFDSLSYVGATICWNDGLVFDLHATLDPSRFEEARKARAPDAKADPLATANPSTLAAISGRLEWPLLFDAGLQVVPDEQKETVRLATSAINGLFLGKDFRRDILNGIGPAATARIDAPGHPQGSFPLVLDVEIGDAEVSAAIDNALKTAWALAALDGQKRGIKLESRAIAGCRVASLVGGERNWSYAIAPGRLAIGTDAEAVASSLTAVAKPGGTPLGRLRDEFFPGSHAFAVVDLQSLYRAVDDRRDLLSRRLSKGRGQTVAETRRDLDRSLDLIGLFRVAYLTAGVKADGSAFHVSAGLIAKRVAR